MVVEKLVSGLKHTSPLVRIETLRILAMLEETEALPALRALLTTETDPDVRTVLKWAGMALWQAEQRGYTTRAAIYKFFRLDRAPSPEELEEQKKLKMLEQQADIDRIRNQQDSLGQRAANTALWGAVGMALGGTGMGASMMLSSAMGIMSGTGEDDARPAEGKPIEPQRPTNTDISVWLNRLREDDPRRRRAAIAELRALNNLAAMPYLAYHFALDLDLDVRDDAQLAGKTLYFNWAYSEEVAAREAADLTAAKPAAPEPPSNAAEILARAQAAREARKKK
jgi:HEAT repeat protein